MGIGEALVYCLATGLVQFNPGNSDTMGQVGPVAWPASS